MSGPNQCLADLGLAWSLEPLRFRCDDDDDGFTIVGLAGILESSSSFSSSSDNRLTMRRLRAFLWGGLCIGIGLDRGLRLGRFAGGNDSVSWWVVVAVRIGVDTVCFVSRFAANDGSFDSSAACVRSPVGAIDPCLDSSKQARRRRAGVGIFTASFTAWTMVQ